MACLLCHSSAQHELGIKDDYAVVECDSCGLRFLDPIPSAQALNEYYNSEQNQGHYIKVAERKLKSGKRKLRPLLRLAKGKRFLDIGCNAGANTEAARQLGLETMGIDLGDAVIRNARDLFPLNNFESMTVEALAEQVQAGTREGFDLIYCSEVLEHTTEPQSFIAAIKQVMNPGAILYLTTPDAGHFRVPRDFTSWKHVHAPDHIFYFNRETLRTLFENNGIRVLRFKLTTRTNLQVIAKNHRKEKI